MGFCVGIADLLATLRKSQKRFQDAGRGPGSAAHSMDEAWAMLGHSIAKCMYKHPMLTSNFSDVDELSRFWMLFQNSMSLVHLESKQTYGNIRQSISCTCSF